MIEINIDQASLNRVLGKFKKHKVSVANQVEVGIGAGLDLILNEAKEVNVPVVTGSLKRSLHKESVRTISGGYSGKVGTNLEYAEAMEFGGSRQKPEGYLRKSIDEKGEAAITEIVDSLKLIL